MLVHPSVLREQSQEWTRSIGWFDGVHLSPAKFNPQPWVHTGPFSTLGEIRFGGIVLTANQVAVKLRKQSKTDVGLIKYQLQRLMGAASALGVQVEFRHDTVVIAGVIWDAKEAALFFEKSYIEAGRPYYEDRVIRRRARANR